MTDTRKIRMDNVANELKNALSSMELTMMAMDDDIIYATHDAEHAVYFARRTEDVFLPAYSLSFEALKKLLDQVEAEVTA